MFSQDRAKLREGFVVAWRKHRQGHPLTPLEAQIVGISAQDVASKDAFVAKHGFDFPLLADTDKEVAAAYGTLGPIGFPRRSTFIIDADGVIRYAHRAIAGLTYRPVSELIQELDKLR